jgi:hypothetical protein
VTREQSAHGVAEFAHEISRARIAMSLCQRREAREVREQKGLPGRVLR